MTGQLNAILPRPSRVQPHHLLLLRASLLEGEAAAQAWSQFKAGHDLMTMDPASNALAPLLYANLERAGVPDAGLGILKGTYRYHWTRSRLVLRGVASALAILEGAGIAPLLLHGAPLASAVYADPALRPLGEAVLFLPAGDRPQAVSLLERDGWRVTWVDQARSRMARGEEVLDLPTTVMWDSGIDPDALAGRAVRIRVEGRPALALSPSDELIAAALRAVAWSDASSGPPMTALADAAALIARGPAADFTLRVLRYGLGVPVAAVLDLLASEIGMGEAAALRDALGPGHSPSAALEFRLRARRGGLVSGHLRDWLRARRVRESRSAAGSA